MQGVCSTYVDTIRSPRGDHSQHRTQDPWPRRHCSGAPLGTAQMRTVPSWEQVTAAASAGSATGTGAAHSVKGGHVRTRDFTARGTGGGGGWGTHAPVGAKEMARTPPSCPISRHTMVLEAAS